MRHIQNEHIDDLVAGRLSPLEAQEIEAAVKSDPSLLQEYQLQQDIQSSLIQARKTALKERLKAIDTNLIPLNKWDMVRPWMAFTAGISALIIATVIFFPYLTKNAETVTQAVTATTEEAMNMPPAGPDTPAISKQNTEMPEMPAELKSNFKPERNPVKKQSSSAISIPPGESSSPQALEPADQGFKSGSLEKEDNSNSDAGMEVAGSANAKPLDIITVKDTKFDLHYKNFDGKLYLYGDFKGKIYELIEINSRIKKYFLYYEKKYYSLKSNQREMQPLQLVSEKSTIEELDLRRKTK
jgi:hypothetical protein